KYSSIPATTKNTNVSATMLKPIFSLPPNPCHPERSGCFAREAATQSKDPYQRSRIFNSRGSPPIYLKHIQVPKQQSQTHQSQSRPAKHHAHRPLAQTLLHFLLRFTG